MINSTKTYKEISFRLAREDDKHLIPYDHTKLSAFNTCPTWGVIRFAHHKRFDSKGRAMALEAGVAMHEVFQLVRLVTLARQLAENYDKGGDFINTMMDHQGKRMFGPERWQWLCDESPKEEDEITRLKHDAINVLESSGFYDDMYDKRRTLTNLEECALFYIDKWNWQPQVWMRDFADPLSDVGIEIPFDVVCELDNGPSFRFTGKIDGIRWHNKQLRIEDNKTASRLNDAWEQSFDTSHQITGYCAAASVFTQQQVRNGEAIGLAIPMPRAEYLGYVRAIVDRSDDQFVKWINWMIYTVQQFREFSPQPLEAPMFTHSCNRYFRPCSFIPFCSASRDERKAMLDEMIIDEWSPLHTITDTEGE